MNETARQMPPDSSISELLADFITGLDVVDVPDDVVHYARVLMRDLLGTALAGVDTDETCAMLKAAVFALPEPGSLESVLGTLRRPKPG